MNTILIEPLSVRVQRGLDRLDQCSPDWWREDRTEGAIDVGRLDIANGFLCLRGQLGWDSPLMLQVLDGYEMRELGMAGWWISRDDQPAYLGDCHGLTEYWVAAIRTRRARAVGVGTPEPSLDVEGAGDAEPF